MPAPYQLPKTPVETLDWCIRKLEQRAGQMHPGPALREVQFLIGSFRSKRSEIQRSTTHGTQ